MLCIVLGIFLSLPINQASVGLNIDGFIDLGPEWNYQYKIERAQGITVDKSNENSATDEENSKNSEINDRPYFRNAVVDLKKHPNANDDIRKHVVNNNTSANASEVLDDKNQTIPKHTVQIVNAPEEVKISTKKKWRKIIRMSKNEVTNSGNTTRKKLLLRKNTKPQVTEVKTAKVPKIEVKTTIVPRATKLAEITEVKTTNLPKNTEVITTNVPKITEVKTTTKSTIEATRMNTTNTNDAKNVINEIKNLITVKITMADTHSDVTHQIKISTSKRKKDKQNRDLLRHDKSKHKYGKKRNTTSVKQNPHRANKTERLSVKRETLDEDIFVIPHKVRQDKNLTSVLLNIFEKSKYYLADLKRRLKDYDKVTNITSTYKKKFKEFAEEAQRINIKTKSGTQKVMLDALESSNVILEKIINFLIDHVKETPFDPTKIEEYQHILRHSLDGEIDDQYKLICEKYSVCRSKYDFTKFTIDLIDELLRCNDEKLKIASSSLMKAVKGTRFRFLDSNATKKIDVLFNWLDNCHLKILRTVWTTARNTLAAANKPLAISGLSHRRVNQTVAFMDIMSIFSENIPANDENLSLWKDIVSGLSSYADGKRNETKEALAFMNTLVLHLVTSTNDFRYEVVNSIRKRLKVALL